MRGALIVPWSEHLQAEHALPPLRQLIGEVLALALGLFLEEPEDEFLLEHREDIAAMRPQMETLLANAAGVQEQITQIESRRKAIEEVQARTYTIMNLFEDVRLNLETMGAHKAIIDDVTKKIGGLGFAVQEADNMLRALKQERQLAQQVEESIKAVR